MTEWAETYDDLDLEERPEPPDYLPPDLRSPAKRQHDAIECFSKAFAQEQLTFDDVGPYVTVAAYRLTRFRLYLTNRMALDEDLAEADISWSAPCSVISTGHLKPYERIIFERSLALITERPVPLDPSAAVNGTLEAWVTQTRALAFDLKLDKPSEAYPFASARVVKTLIHPNAIGRIWPSPAQLYEFNEQMLIDIYSRLVEHGHEPTIKHLIGQFGFTFTEAVALLRCSKRIGPRITQTTADEERSLNAMRAELTHRKSVGALDPRGQMHAIKHLAIIHGLGRSEPEDQQLEFTRLVAKVSRAEPPPQRPAITTTARPVEPSD